MMLMSGSVGKDAAKDIVARALARSRDDRDKASARRCGVCRRRQRC